MDMRKKETDEKEFQEKQYGNSGGKFIYQCPFGNGDSYRQGIRWIQETMDRLSYIENCIGEIKKNGINTASRIEEVRQEIKFWSRIVSLAVGIPAVIVAILKIISEFQVHVPK